MTAAADFPPAAPAGADGAGAALWLAAAALALALARRASLMLAPPPGAILSITAPGAFAIPR